MMRCWLWYNLLTVIKYSLYSKIFHLWWDVISVMRHSICNKILPLWKDVLSVMGCSVCVKMFHLWWKPILVTKFSACDKNVLSVVRMFHLWWNYFVCDKNALSVARTFYQWQECFVFWWCFACGESVFSVVIVFFLCQECLTKCFLHNLYVFVILSSSCYLFVYMFLPIDTAAVLLVMSVSSIFMHTLTLAMIHTITGSSRDVSRPAFKLLSGVCQTPSVI